jgi:hypothetical protein
MISNIWWHWMMWWWWCVIHQSSVNEVMWFDILLCSTCILFYSILCINTRVIDNLSSREKKKWGGGRKKKVEEKKGRLAQFLAFWSHNSTDQHVETNEYSLKSIRWLDCANSKVNQCCLLASAISSSGQRKQWFEAGVSRACHKGDQAKA